MAKDPYHLDDVRQAIREFEHTLLEYEQELYSTHGKPELFTLLRSTEQLEQLLHKAERHTEKELARALVSLVATHVRSSQKLSRAAIDTLLTGTDNIIESLLPGADRRRNLLGCLDKVNHIEAQLNAEAPLAAPSVTKQDSPSEYRLRIANPAASRSILIVDDDSVSRVLMSTMLREFGDCDVVASGFDAIDKVRAKLSRNEHYDLVILDILMPDLDGIRVLAAIRAAETERVAASATAARIVMITGLSEYESFEQAFRARCDAYVVKPISKCVLIRELSRIGIEPIAIRPRAQGATS